MSKKNSLKSRKRYQDFIVRDQQRREDKSAAKQERKEERLRLSAQDHQLNKKRAAGSKKPKVVPVVAKQAKLLKRQLKSLSINTETKKINMADSDDSSSSDGESETEQMEGVESAVQQLPSLTGKQIQKKPKFSRAHYKEMKKEMKRRLKNHTSGSKRRAEKLAEAQQLTIRRFKDREGVMLDEQ